MVCPRCTNPHAQGLNCQRCGFGLVEVPPADMEKKHTDADLADAVRSANEGAMELRRRAVRLSEQYAALVREHNALQVEHSKLKAMFGPMIAANQAKREEEEAKIAAAAPLGRAVVNCAKCGFPDGAYVQHECKPVEVNLAEEKPTGEAEPAKEPA